MVHDDLQGINWLCMSHKSFGSERVACWFLAFPLVRSSTPWTGLCDGCVSSRYTVLFLVASGRVPGQTQQAGITHLQVLSIGPPQVNG